MCRTYSNCQIIYSEVGGIYYLDTYLKDILTSRMEECALSLVWLWLRESFIRLFYILAPLLNSEMWTLRCLPMAYAVRLSSSKCGSQSLISAPFA